jgi:hypothetical protein
VSQVRFLPGPQGEIGADVGRPRSLPDSSILGPLSHQRNEVLTSSKRNRAVAISANPAASERPRHRTSSRCRTTRCSPRGRPPERRGLDEPERPCRGRGRPPRRGRFRVILVLADTVIEHTAGHISILRSGSRSTGSSPARAPRRASSPSNCAQWAAARTRLTHERLPAEVVESHRGGWGPIVELVGGLLER